MRYDHLGMNSFDPDDFPILSQRAVLAFLAMLLGAALLIKRRRVSPANTRRR